MKHIKKIMIMMMAGTMLCSGQSVLVHATAVTSENGQAAASDDNSLSSLSLSEGQISPALQSGVTKYTATVPNDVTEVEVSARTTNPKASITSISGNTNLSEGENLISIVVTAENGSAATYKITVTRQTANETGAADGASDGISTVDESDVVPIAETEESVSVADGTDLSDVQMESDSTPEEQYDALKEKYDSLHDKYEELKKHDQSKIYGLTGACVALVVICLILFWRRRKEQEEDDLFADDVYEEDGYEADYGEDDGEDYEEDGDRENEPEETDEIDEENDYVEGNDYEEDDVEADYEDSEEGEDYDTEEDYEEEDYDEEYEEDEDYDEEVDYEEDEPEEDYDTSYDEEFEEEEPEKGKRERSSRKRHGRKESTEDKLEVIDFNDL